MNLKHCLKVNWRKEYVWQFLIFQDRFTCYACFGGGRVYKPKSSYKLTEAELAQLHGIKNEGIENS